MKKIRLKVGTRGSSLALTQTAFVVRSLRRKFPSLEIETVTLQTAGDKITNVPLAQIGSKGVFIKEIEDALLQGKIDLAVHSLKDLTTDLPQGLALGAALKREDPRDCLVSKRYKSLVSLPEGARVGTSALRRGAQILALRPNLRVQNLRGNLDTRLRKLKEGNYDAIVIAHAGVKRLYGASRDPELNFSVVPYSQILPAVGQGILAIEIRKSDPEAETLVRSLNDPGSYRAALAERAFLRQCEGGCQVPIGVRTRIVGKRIEMEGVIASLEGKNVVRRSAGGSILSPEDVGVRLAEKILSCGGREILETIRS
ncbi:MAG: hydroxymethylbilane synthase [Elusimicrobia bacterium]|nr:hydroxymethylbilane synthase [Elusimicrobiota bacterium]